MTRRAHGPDVLIGPAACVVGATLALLAVPSVAYAGTGDNALSASVNWTGYSATLASHDHTTGAPDTTDVGSNLGAGLNVEYERSIGEAFSLRAELGAALWDNSKGTSYGGLLAGEFVYRFDVLKYVPYLIGGGGAVYTGGGPLPGSFDAVLVLGGGLDILHSRESSYGFEARIASSANTTVISAGFRLTWRWGYF